MAEDGWRLPATYRPLYSTCRTGLAWEFLRRNRVFQAVSNRLTKGDESDPQSSGTVEEAARPWGVLNFRTE